MQILFDKLEEFLKKYYLNHFIKGSIYFGAFALILSLSVLLLEYVGRFNGAVRATFFFGGLLAIIAFLVYYCILPLLKIWGIQKRMDYTEASKIIGSFFPEVSDRLLNTLQLYANSQGTALENSLLIASIEQRTKELKPVRFELAIDFTENKRYLKYVLIPLGIFLLIFFSSPEVLTESGKRIVQYNQEFVAPEPFQLQVLSQPLQVRKGEDFTLSVGVEGEIVPEKLFVNTENARFKLKRNKNLYEYTFKKVQRTQAFTLESAEIRPKEFKLEVVPNPIIVNFDIQANYPDYTGKTDERIKNNGDLIVPEGTELNWEVATKDATNLTVLFSDTALPADRSGEDFFSVKNTLYSTQQYRLAVSYDAIQGRDTAQYTIKVVPDNYPSIETEEVTDSTNVLLRYFQGVVKDDYGFSSCYFHYSIRNEKGEEVKSDKESIAVNTQSQLSSFSYLWNMQSLNLAPGQTVNYFFEVYDNDRVNGPKSTKTAVYAYRSPSKTELAEKASEANQKTKNELEEALTKAQEVQKEIKDFKRKLIEKKNLDWNDKEQLKNLINQQKSLQQQFNELKNENKKNLNEQEQFEGMSEELLEKQRELEELMEKLMTDEMKEMLEKMEALMEEMDKNQLQQELNKMELSNEDLEKELDRSLEMFKRLDFETKLQENIDKASELAKKQEELKEKTENGEASDEELAKEQNELQKEAEELRKDMEELSEKNEELERPESLPDMSEKMEETQQEMEKSEQNLNEGKKNKSQQNQDKAKQNLEEMAQSLSSFQQQMQQEKHYEDMESLRALLENLIQLSFDQEEIIEETKTLKRNDPRFVSVTQLQKNTQDNAQVAEDSLLALSKRIAEIEPTINKEMNRVNKSMEEAVQALADRNPGLAASKEQYAMTSLNNLALLLDEILQQMQQEMNSMMQSKGSCSKPGSNSMPSMGDLKKMQQQLNEQLKKLQEQMQQGKQPNGKKPGGQQGQGMSEQVAKMAARQAAIREQLRKLEEQLSDDKEGKQAGGSLKKLQELMNQTEEDLVNWQVNQETIKRQEEILTRLLESEKAEREQEFEKKRESKEAKEEYQLVEEQLKQYKLTKQKEIELIRTLPPELNEFYREKVGEYMNY